MEKPGDNTFIKINSRRQPIPSLHGLLLCKTDNLSENTILPTVNNLPTPKSSRMYNPNLSNRKNHRTPLVHFNIQSTLPFTWNSSTKKFFLHFMLRRICISRKFRKIKRPAQRWDKLVNNVRCGATRQWPTWPVRSCSSPPATAANMSSSSKLPKNNPAAAQERKSQLKITKKKTWGRCPLMYCSIFCLLLYQCNIVLVPSSVTWVYFYTGIRTVSHEGKKHYQDLFWSCITSDLGGPDLITSGIISQWRVNQHRYKFCSTCMSYVETDHAHYVTYEWHWIPVSYECWYKWLNQN